MVTCENYQKNDTPDAQDEAAARTLRTTKDPTSQEAAQHLADLRAVEFVNKSTNKVMK